VKGPKDSKDSHTSVTMEGTLENELDCSHLPLSGFVNYGLYECGALPAYV
jgi:hypothetical protein